MDISFVITRTDGMKRRENVCRGVHILSWSEGNRYNKYSEAVSEILLAQAPLKHCGKGECYGKIRSNNDYILLKIIYSPCAN